MVLKFHKLKRKLFAGDLYTFRFLTSVRFGGKTTTTTTMKTTTSSTKSPYFSSSNSLMGAPTATTATATTARIATAPSDRIIASSAGAARRKRSHVKLEYSKDDDEDSSITIKREKEPEEEEADKSAIIDGSNDVVANRFVVVQIKREPRVAEEDAEQDGEGKEETKKEIWEPALWRDQLSGIREMRKNRDAPVDTMGCERCHDHDALPRIQRYQILVSLMLSSQTRDEVTSAAMNRLKRRGLTPSSLLDMSDEELGELIKPVGFWRKKIGYLKKTSRVVADEYGGDIPATIEELCKLPGVGPKMAYLTVQCAWGRQDGIGVDTHVHRISNRLGWLMKETKSPEETRKSLETWLPPQLWGEINELLVGFGQQICRPVGPRCYDCVIKSICPYGMSNVKSSPKKSPSKIKILKMEDKIEIKPEIKMEPKLELDPNL